MPIHGEKCSSKAKHDISGKDYTVGGSKTVEKGPSKVSAPQRTEKTSKSSLDEKSSQRSPSDLKKQLMSRCLVAAAPLKKHQDVLKKKSRVEEPPRTENNSSKTREPSKASSVSKDSQWQKRSELFEEMCKRHQENKTKRSVCTEAKTPSASSKKHSSTSAKHTTSVSSSNVVKNVPTIPGIVTSVSHKTVKSSSSAQKPICSVASPLPFSFKIPKKVQSRPVVSIGENNEAVSTNRNLTHGTERLDSGASTSNSKQETVQQAHSCLDVAPSFSSEAQHKRSSLSGPLPATSHTVTEPRYDQVIKSII